MKVLCLSRYGQLGASSRLRMYQYLPSLRKAGIDVTVCPLLNDDYIHGLYAQHIPKLSVIKAYFSHLVSLLKASKFDVVWVEKEILPWLPSWIELGLLPSNIALVVDYDDAVFHRYDQHAWAMVRSMLGQKIDKVMKRAQLVIAGNDYLAERARHAGAANIAILPTVVDITRYQVAEPISHQALTIGWIGSPSTTHFLREAVIALKDIVIKKDLKIVAVGASAEPLTGLPVIVLPWTEKTEVAHIQAFDIGIMPLANGLFEQGKCGYKLIQYMACGKPVIASPVGVNTKIVQQGVNGFLASAPAEWIDALDKLTDDQAMRNKMGGNGRLQVEMEYSLQVVSPKLIDLFKSTIQ